MPIHWRAPDDDEVRPAYGEVVISSVARKTPMPETLVVVNIGTTEHPDIRDGVFLGLLRPGGCDRCGSVSPTAVVRLQGDPFGIFFLWEGPLTAVTRVDVEGLTRA